MTILCQGAGVWAPAVNLATGRQGRQVRRKRPGSGGALPPLPTPRKPAVYAPLLRVKTPAFGCKAWQGR